MIRWAIGRQPWDFLRGPRGTLPPEVSPGGEFPEPSPGALPPKASPRGESPEPSPEARVVHLIRSSTINPWEVYTAVSQSQSVSGVQRYTPSHWSAVRKWYTSEYRYLSVQRGTIGIHNWLRYITSSSILLLFKQQYLPHFGIHRYFHEI